LLIGPNSTVVIDEFVYDPATNKGNIAATLTQGSFRYIGGKLSKQGNATLKTPVATLGIRGSDVTIGYNSSTTQMNVVTTHGNATLQAGNDVLTLRGGFGTTVSGGQADGAVGTADRGRQQSVRGPARQERRRRQAADRWRRREIGTQLVGRSQERRRDGACWRRRAGKRCIADHALHT